MLVDLRTLEHVRDVIDEEISRLCIEQNFSRSAARCEIGLKLGFYVSSTESD